MSFNIDDPLAGILSDGSDDSFFDDDILGKKKTTKKKSTPTTEKKNALFDLGKIDKSKPAPSVSESKKDSLFDFGSDSKKASNINESKNIISSTSPTPFKRSVSKESFKIPQADAKTKPASDKLDFLKSPAKPKVSTNTDKIDILSELNTDARKDVAKSIDKAKGSQSMLDDILGGSSTGGSSQVVRPVTAAKSQEFDLESFLGKSDSKQTASSTKTAPQKHNIKMNKPKEDATNQMKKKSSEDWLGIFQDKDVNDADDDETGMPSWLSRGDSKKKKVESENKVVERELKKEKPKQEAETEILVEKQPNSQPNKEQLLQTVPSSNILQSTNEDITAEGAALYLQQQESQLMVAMQLKAQEEKLVTMQMRQKESQRVQREAVLAQHTQLDAMLRRQADQRQQMQAIIASHQERISQRIKALLSTSNVDNEDMINNKEEYENNTLEQRESPYIKEKKQLLQLVQSLQENHDKEIDLMETSYRRQLVFLEVSLNQAEERMKEESDKLVKFYTEKIHWLEEHHHQYKKMTEENLNSQNERHKAENEMLREQYLENVKILQEHHAALMENIKNAVKQEQVLIQDSAGFSASLHELVADVKENKFQCQQLVENVQKLTENTQRDTERSLQAREAQINDMIQQLKKERENFESEKSESREMVKMLEIRLKQMTTMIEDESAALKQKKMEFEFEKATFSKQTEFAKNILKKQDDEMKTLREDIHKEYQEKNAKIEEERAKAVKDSASIAKEKASVQNLKQELEILKAELQAQLEEVTEERSKLNVEKQQLHMEEQRILAKSRDFDLLAKTAIDKQSQADKKYSEAEFLQRKYEERIRRIQEHVVSLNLREKQIAKEKVSLSRERLSLHNERKQVENRRQCSLCKSTQDIPEYNFVPGYTLPDSFLNVPVSRDYRSANANSAMNAIEQEMASFMSRNFSMRHTSGIGNIIKDPKQTGELTQIEGEPFKDLMDPKFMMLRLDVQKVLSNLDQNKKGDNEMSDELNEDPDEVYKEE